MTQTSKTAKQHEVLSGHVLRAVRGYASEVQAQCDELERLVEALAVANAASRKFLALQHVPPVGASGFSAYRQRRTVGTAWACNSNNNYHA